MPLDRRLRCLLLHIFFVSALPPAEKDDLATAAAGTGKRERGNLRNARVAAYCTAELEKRAADVTEKKEKKLQ